MNIALHNKQLLALIALVLLTALVVSYFVLSMVAHVDVWQLLSVVTPSAMYPH